MKPMTVMRRPWTRVSVALAASSLLAGPALLGAAESGDEHAGHDMHAGHQMDTGRDEMGRRLFGQSHQMTPEMYKELREKVQIYQGYTDAQIDLSMQQMGPEYQWYISGAGVQGEQGVLVLSHGFREQGDIAFKKQIEPFANIFPTSMAIGMAMMMSDHVQLALDDLEAAGAKTVVVIPILATRYNELMRQWEYIFGLRDEAEFVTVPQVKTKLKVVMASPPEDDPLIGEILIDWANELSSDPSKETVIVAAHGATSDADNAKELKILDNLARMVQEDGGFAEVVGITLQDDAPAEVRDANVAKLRKVAETAKAQGREVLVVTNLIGTRTIQPKLRKDLKGLDYKFNAKGITQHDNFEEWMGETIREALDNTGRAAAR